MPRRAIQTSASSYKIRSKFLAAAPSAPSAELDPKDRLERWQRKLLDLSLRNALLNFKPGKKTLSLEVAGAAVRRATGGEVRELRWGADGSLLAAIGGHAQAVPLAEVDAAVQDLIGLVLRLSLLQLRAQSGASVPLILAKGAQFYRDYGMGRSLGTMPFQLAGNVRHGGLVERAFGLTLRELVEDYGGGTASGRPLKAAQVGGPLGAWVPPSQFDTPLDYEAFAAIGAMLGHGGVVVADDSLDMAQMARFAMQFCAEESCGKCTPCRIGSTRGVEVIDRLLAAPEQGARDQQVVILKDLCDTLQYGSLCALGGMTSYPVASALKHFPADFGLQPSEAEQ